MARKTYSNLHVVLNKHLTHYGPRWAILYDVRSATRSSSYGLYQLEAEPNQIQMRSSNQDREDKSSVTEPRPTTSEETPQFQDCSGILFIASSPFGSATDSDDMQGELNR